MNPFKLRKSDIHGVGQAPPNDPHSYGSYTDDGGGFDISEIASIRGSIPGTFIDDRLLDEDGKLVNLDPAKMKVREHMVLLGNAAEDVTLAEFIERAGVHNANAAELSGRYSARKTALLDAGAELLTVHELVEALERMPDNVPPKYAKPAVWVCKPVFLLGDASLVYGLFYTSGVPGAAALFAGLSAAVGAVWAGSVTGRLAKLAYQRKRRGKAPEGAPGAVLDLYEDQDREDMPASLWTGAAAAWALGLGLAVTVVGVGAGADPVESLGSGLLTMLTVGGSGFAEAYATNSAAERLEKHTGRKYDLKAEIAEIGDIKAERDAEASRNQTVLAAGSHRAAAAMNTTLVVADSSIHDPKVHGYESPADPASTTVTLRNEPGAPIGAPTPVEVRIKDEPDPLEIVNAAFITSLGIRADESIGDEAIAIAREEAAGTATSNAATDDHVYDERAGAASADGIDLTDLAGTDHGSAFADPARTSFNGNNR